MRQPPSAHSIIGLLEEATLSEAGSLQHSAHLFDFAGWDSIGVVMFIGLVLEHYNITITVADIRASSTVDGLLELLTQRADSTP